MNGIATSKENIDVVINTNLGTVTLTNDMLKEMVADKDGKVTVVISVNTTKLSVDAKAAIGNRPIIDVGILAGHAAIKTAIKLEINYSLSAADANYYNQIAIAKVLGLTLGIGDNKFNPNAEISRQDMMVLVSNALKVAKKQGEQGNSNDLKQFADATTVAGYAVDSIASLVKEGIIVGTGKNIDPTGTATRAQAAVVLYKLYNR